MKKFFLKLLGFLRKKSKIAVDVVNLVKKIVESDAAFLLTELIPGDVDNAIRARLLTILPKVATEMAFAHQILSADSTKPSVIVAALIDHLKSLNPEGRKAFWVQFAALINMQLEDGKLDFNEAVIASLMIYKEFYSKKK